MSAFVVNDYHINALATYARREMVSFYWRNERYEFNRDTVAELAAELYSENVRSVNHRYNQRQRRKGFNYQPVLIDHLEHANIIGACDCLRYQSCETRNYRNTLAYAALNAIREEAITLLIEQDRSWELHPMGNQRLVESAKELGTIQFVSVR